MNMIQFNRDGQPYDVFFNIDFQKKLVDNITVTAGGINGTPLVLSDIDRQSIKMQIEYEIALELLDNQLAKDVNSLKM